MRMEINQVRSGVVQAVQVRSATKGSVSVPQQPETTAKEESAAQDELKLTNAEKQYFADVFPGSAHEIRSHVLYRKNGEHQHSSLGTVIDRKG
jgi:hypothetical protein